MIVCKLKGGLGNQMFQYAFARCLAHKNNTEIKIYYKTDSEFEKVRELCLEEDNWLRYNYTKENLVVEEHTGYGVVYQKSTGKPMVMGGVFNDGRYPKNVAKQINQLRCLGYCLPAKGAGLPAAFLRLL